MAICAVCTNEYSPEYAKDGCPFCENKVIKEAERLEREKKKEEKKKNKKDKDKDKKDKKGKKDKKAKWGLMLSPLCSRES